MPAQKNTSLKTVIITGAATGIGFETVRKLLETRQYRVLIIARRPNHLAAAVDQLGGHSEYLGSYICDLEDEKQIEKTLDQIFQSNKSIYGLVNNAGVYPFGGIQNTTSKQWDETFRINLKAAFLMSQGVLKEMIHHADGGRIVNVSSTAGVLPNHFALAYSVSKAALIQFSKTLAKEVGKHNITVNTVCPGIVRTPLHEAYHANQNELEEFYAKRGAAHPLGRVGEPQDVAHAIRFFLSEEASWVTGETFIIDGGRLLL